jgi:hypothetical protein
LGTATNRHRSGAAGRLYGVRSRVSWFRAELPEGRHLLPWFPASWFTDPLALADMCSPWERAWVRRCLACDYRGEGAVVELGTWLGAITLAIIRGLEDRPDAPVHVYDLFVSDDIERRVAELPVRSWFADDTSFLNTYRERLGEGGTRVSIHEGDILEEAWDGGPIEFLFDDLAKTWDIWNHVRSTFYRDLIPGAVLVEQDWVHACTPWIHLWHHRHRDHFELLGQVPRSGSVAFRVLRRLPDEALAADAFADYDDAEIAEAFIWAASFVGEPRRADVRGARAHLYTLFGDLDVATSICVDELAAGGTGELLTQVVPELARRRHDRDRGA